MKSILVPVDFNEKSKEAIKVALKIVGEEPAKLHLVHAVDLPVKLSMQGHSYTDTSYFNEIAAERFEKLKEEFKFPSNVEVSTHIDFNVVSMSVKLAVDEYDIDFIIMGSDGASGVKEIFIGSNAEKVIRDSKVPVLIIKQKLENFEIKRVTMACDFSEKYDSAVEKAVKFIKMIGKPSIDLLYVNTPYQFATNAKVKKLFDRFINKYPNLENCEFHIYNDTHVEDGIMNFCIENDTDIICMFPTGRKGLMYFFNGSVSEDLVNRTAKTVLTVRV